ncbi:MAG: hypothetical protein WAZ77_12255 [Candidatus Nitrosopolaris sp.]
MEYRGYDSVGIATINNGKIVVKKDIGKVADVNKSLDLGRMPGHTGIGHTRLSKIIKSLEKSLFS